MPAQFIFLNQVPKDASCILRCGCRVRVDASVDAAGQVSLVLIQCIAPCDPRYCEFTGYFDVGMDWYPGSKVAAEGEMRVCYDPLASELEASFG